MPQPPHPRSQRAEADPPRSVSDKDRHEIERTARTEVLESDRFAEIVYQCPSSKVSAGGSGSSRWPET
jgi:hypothetical protein